MELCSQLRAASDALHTQVEALPLAQAMVAGTVDRDDYVRLLQHQLAVHTEWEAEVARQPVCAAVWDAGMARAAVIQHDLEALGADAQPADHPAAGKWLSAVRGRARTQPEVWLGVIYLFEGSRVGSMALLRPVARALGVAPAPGTGVDYHLDGIGGLIPRWQRFKGLLNSLPLTPDQQAAAVWGAVATFEMLHALYAAPAPALAAAAG